MVIFMGLWHKVGVSLTEGTMLAMWSAFFLAEIKEVLEARRDKKLGSYIGNMWNQVRGVGGRHWNEF